MYQFRQHCYVTCNDPISFYYGKLVRIREAFTLAGRRLYKVSFGNVTFHLPVEAMR